MSRYVIFVTLCITALLSLSSCNANPANSNIHVQTLSEEDMEINNAHEIDISEFSDFFDREGFDAGMSQSYFMEFLSKYKYNGTALDTSCGVFVDTAKGGGWSTNGHSWSARNYYDSDGRNAEYLNSFSFQVPIEGLTMPYGIEVGSSISDAFERICIKAEAEEVITSKEAKQELLIYKSDSELLALKPTLKDNEISTYTIAYAKKQIVKDSNGDNITVTKTFDMDFKHKDGTWTLETVSVKVNENYKVK